MSTLRVSLKSELCGTVDRTLKNQTSQLEHCFTELFSLSICEQTLSLSGTKHKQPSESLSLPFFLYACLFPEVTLSFSYLEIGGKMVTVRLTARGQLGQFRGF